MTRRYRISEIKLRPGDDLAIIPDLIAKKLRIDIHKLANVSNHAGDKGDKPLIKRVFRDEELAPGTYMIMKESIDAREKPDIRFVYTVDFVTNEALKPAKNQAKHLTEITDTTKTKTFGEEERREYCVYDNSLSVNIFDGQKALHQEGERINKGTEKRPVVIGFGPAGIFAALELARNGYRPIVIERGSSMEKRISDVESFRRSGVLDPDSNMLFGEGGAGTFSDGKLTSGIKNDNIRYVLSVFRDAGAGDDIMYKNHPHIGTDVLRTVIVNIRKCIEDMGGEVIFDTALSDLKIENGRLIGIKVQDTKSQDTKGEDVKSQDTKSPVGEASERYIETDKLILAIGHSARDTFELIHGRGLKMEQKAISIGVRIEHPQSLIDEAQYGKEALERYDLPPAEYKLSYKSSNGRGVYSFCMCPGGEVVICATAPGELCVNGMSKRARNSGTANSGILCDVRCEDYDDSDPLAGVRFQQRYERAAYQNVMNKAEGAWSAPSCRMSEFLDPDDGGSDINNSERVINSLPEFASESIREAIPEFARKIKGYDDDDAIVTAVETRSSSPVRIIRDETGMSNIKGIFPCGEGAGYAGGITSAACDGIRAAQRLMDYTE